MGIIFKSNFKPKKLSDDLIKSQADILSRSLELEVGEIEKRTEGGRDANNAPFKRYSDGYKKWRTKKGYSLTPNLRVRGNMLRAMTSKVTSATKGLLIGRIFFNSTTEAKKAKWNQKTRGFFRLSKEQVQRITDKLKRIINV